MATRTRFVTGAVQHCAKLKDTCDGIHLRRLRRVLQFMSYASGLTLFQITSYNGYESGHGNGYGNGYGNLRSVMES